MKMRGCALILSLLYLFLLGSSGTVPSILDSPNIPTTEYDALQDFYAATNGQYWVWRNASFGIAWDFTEIVVGEQPNPCSSGWQGLKCSCDVDSCNIASINLQNYNISGTLPTSMGSFPALYNLNLYSNMLTHHIPKELGLLTRLTYLGINFNRLTGPIPSELATLTQMQHFDVSDNTLTGPIPAELWPEMPYLEELYLDRNHFAGPLPASMGSLANATKITLAINPYLNGPIPDSFGNLTSLTSALWYNSALEGTLPASLGNLKKLVYLEVYGNQLEGSIPDSFCGMDSLMALYLQSNSLTGPIPSCIGDLSNLEMLGLFHNHMTGHLPATIYNFLYMLQFEIYDNHFSGPFDEAVGTYSYCMYFQINFNAFTGPLPGSLSELSSMLIFDVSDNSFSGPIPSDLGSQWPYANYVMLYDNQLTGTLPASLGGCASALYLLVSDNRLDGPIPDSIGQMAALEYFDNRWNHFSGSIPESLAGLTDLFYLALSSNSLTGTLPANITALPNLRILFVEENQLTGPLDGVFKLPASSPLTNIDISQNGFTGSLPAAVFDLHLLSTFAANTNCFTGTFPVEMCGAPELVALVLDGISSGKNCRKDIFPDLYRYIKTYVLSIGQTRDLNSCVFTMPKLHTLHMSGNNIVGTLPTDVTVSTALTDLSLSHNDLVGTIPDQFMMLMQDEEGVTSGRRWLNLDLSYNRLKEVLSETLVPLQDAQSLSLQLNRISGNVPSGLHDARNIAILDGNLFACDITGSDLPEHDGTTRIYECGSKSFDISIFLWVGLFAAVLLVGLLIRFNCGTSLETYSSTSRFAPVRKFINFIASERLIFMSVYNDSATQSHSLIAFSNLLKRIRRVVFVLTLFILVVCMPTFAVLTKYYGTYNHEYAWFYSAAYLSGTTATIVLFAVLVALVALLLYLYCSYLHTFEWVSKRKEQFMLRFYQSVVGRKHTFRYYAFVASLVLLNCAVVLAVNGAYIYITLTYNRAIVTVSQVSIALFKLSWNSLVVFDLYLYIKRVYFREGEELSPAEDETTTALSLTYSRQSGYRRRIIEQRDILVQAFIVMFNNIAAPCLAVMVVSSNCFYNAFFTAPAVVTSYSYLYCTLYILNTDECNTYTKEVIGVTYNPPFVYSYACASSFITVYASVFVYKYLLRAFVVPVGTFACGAALKVMSKKSLLYRVIASVTPKLVKPLESEDASAADEDVEDDVHQSVQNQSARLMGEGESKKSFGTSPSRDKEEVFLVSKFLVNIVCNLGILLTFGALFPPLAVVICLSILVNTRFVQLMIGRLLIKAERAKLLSYCYRVDQDCESADKAFKHVVWLLLVFCSLFYSLFVFDILGDAVGWKDAMWAPILMLCVPLAVLLGVSCLRMLFRCIDKSPGGLEVSDNGGFDRPVRSGSGL